MAIILNIKDNVSHDPAAFILESALLLNDKLEYDIQNLIVDLKITENLFSPTLTCKVVFKDSLNLVDEYFREGLPGYRFTGEESFLLTFIREGLDGVIDEFEHEFKISHWTGYTRSVEERVQIFEFTAISLEVYNNSTIKISKHIRGNVLNNIKELAETINIDLQVTGDSTQEGKLIIPMCKPLQAISLLNRNLLDLNNTPFYLFQNNQGEYEFISHSSIIEKDPIGPFYYVNQDSEPAGTVEYYNQRKYRIISAGANFNLSKYYQMETGLFASKNTMIDFTNKKIERYQYKYDSVFPKEHTLYEIQKIDDPTFGVELNNDYSNERYLSRNNYTNWLSDEQSAIMNAYQHIFSSNTLEVTTVGNFDIKPGNILDLQFPVTIDEGDRIFDEYISGNYIVISSTHEFDKSEWYTRSLVKRDSVRQ